MLMIRAELLKLTTTTAVKVAVIIGVVGLILTQITLLTLLPALASGAIGPGLDTLGVALPDFGLESHAAQLAALSPLGASTGSGSLGIAVLAVVILGVLAGTSDYRFGGIVTTALAQPRRGLILVAKIGALALTGLLVGFVYAAINLLTLIISLPLAGAELLVSAPELILVLVRGTVVVTLLVLLGLAVGLLARDQVVGILTMLGLLLFEIIVQSIAQLVSGTLPIWAQIMPLSLAQSAISSPMNGGFPPVVALAVLAALVAVVLAGAGAAMRTRDICVLR
ncbi:hypothetical protein [Arthrobacter antibioticus]|uniref:hypothetical protein n=1 Tax=Arthrobacter sp. H35-MC1 TaxID=3046203 RepID=UPI0024B9CFF0|nr:hypothetical protein [Arthrobacter sp. H35-MC1]MDJ0317369.1 hypothetical protein [Arthrobacter sp. H35-MC1]